MERPKEDAIAAKAIAEGARHEEARRRLAATLQPVKGP